MHKKVQSIVLTGLVSVNALTPIAKVFADSNLETGKETKTEIRVDDEMPADAKVPEEEWTITTIDNLSVLWDYRTENDGTYVLTNYKGGSKNSKVKIPRTINGKAVKLENLNKNVFSGVTHISLAEGSEDVVLLQNSLGDAFANSATIVSVDLAGLKTPNLTSMYGAFAECSNLKYLNLANWNTSKVTTTKEMMFASRNVEMINLTGWDTTLVRDMKSMFYRCSNLITLLGVEGFKTSNVNNMDSVFDSCPKLKSLNLSGWDTSNVTTFNEMFKGCTNLTNLEGLSGWNTEKVITMASMFYKSSNLTSLNLSNWKTGNVTTMSNMFRECRSLTNLEGLGTWNTEKVTNMSFMFRDCNNLTSIEGLNNWNTSSLTNAQEVFNACSKLKSLDLSNWNMDNVTELSWMFNDCTSLVDLKGTEKWKLSNVTRMINVFTNTKLNIIDLSSANLPDSNVLSNANMSEIFKVNSTTEKERKLLVITNDSRLKQYDFNGNNRTQVQTVYNANGGHFQDGQSTKVVNVGYTITPEQAKNIEQLITPNEQPTKKDYKFKGWVNNEVENSSVFDKLDATYTANWERIGIVIEEGDGTRKNPFTLKANTVEGLDKIMNWLKGEENSEYYKLCETTVENGIAKYSLHVVDKDGLVKYVRVKVDNTNTDLKNKLNEIKTLQLPVNDKGNVTLPGIEGGGEIVIKPGQNGETPSYDENGDINIPQNGTIELPGGSNIIASSGGKVNSENGEIILSNGGNITLPGNAQVKVLGGIIIKQNGDIKIHNGESIIIQNGDNNIVVKPGIDNQELTINNEGNIVLPESGGTVTVPNGDIVVPGGSIVKQDGSIEIKIEGEVVLPNGGGTVAVKPGTVINLDGTIKLSIFDKLDASVVYVIEGQGTINNPLILAIKPVTTTKLNTFLNGLNDLRPKVVKITRDNTHTEYKLEVDNKTTHAIIRVENNQTDLVKVLNKFSKTTNSEVSIPNIVKFTDINTHWGKDNIESFASMGFINGYTDGSFKPDNHITRAEFVKIVNNVFGYTNKGSIPFTDVSSNDWFYNDVLIAYKAGYINGRSYTKFEPNERITRQEAAKILTTIMNNSDSQIDKLNRFEDGHLTHEWAKPFVEGAIEAGYLKGDTEGKLNPINNITRAECVTILSRLRNTK